jgi:hypothetical protein
MGDGLTVEPFEGRAAGIAIFKTVNRDQFHTPVTCSSVPRVTPQHCAEYSRE